MSLAESCERRIRGSFLTNDYAKMSSPTIPLRRQGCRSEPWYAYFLLAQVGSVKKLGWLAVLGRLLEGVSHLDQLGFGPSLSEK